MRCTGRFFYIIGAVIMALGLLAASPSLASQHRTGPIPEANRTMIMQEVQTLVSDTSKWGKDLSSRLKDAAKDRYGTGVEIGLSSFTYLIGPKVMVVEPGSPAENAGLHTGDFVERLNGVSYVVDSNEKATREYHSKVYSEGLAASDQETSLDVVWLVLNNEKVELERKSVKLTPVMLRPDRTAEAEKLAQEINTELKPFVAKMEALTKELTEKIPVTKTWEEFNTLIEQTAKPIFDEFMKWLDQKSQQVDAFSNSNSK